jgi:uncharacterized membrane protein
VAAASAVIGGPLGRHAVVGRSRFWTPLRVILLLAVLVLAAGWLGKAPCLQQAPDGAGGLALDWQAGRQYVSMCYTDIVTLYSDHRLAGGDLPYRAHWGVDPSEAANQGSSTVVAPHYMDYPVVTGFFMWEMARVAKQYEMVSASAGWLPTGLVEVVFFDITAALLASAWLIVVWTVRRQRSVRPWDAALVALSPLALLHVFTGMDSLAVAAAAGGMYALARGRSAAAGMLIGLATATKLYASLLLIPVLLVGWRRGRDARRSGMAPGPMTDPAYSGDSTGDAGLADRRVAARTWWAAVLTWAVLNLPVAVVFTPGWLEFFRVGIKGGPEPDSIYYVLSYFTGWTGFDGSLPPGQTPWVLNLVVLGLVVLAVAGLAVLAYVAPRPPRLASLCFLLVAAVLLVNKSWSPQFSLWLVPLAVLALPRWRLLLAWMTVDALVWVPRMFYYLGVDNKGLPPDFFLGFVLVRDAVVILLGVLVVRSVLWPRTDPVRELGADDPDWPLTSAVSGELGHRAVRRSWPVAEHSVPAGRRLSQLRQLGGSVRPTS